MNTKERNTNKNYVANITSKMMLSSYNGKELLWPVKLFLPIFVLHVLLEARAFKLFGIDKIYLSFPISVCCILWGFFFSCLRWDLFWSLGKQFCGLPVNKTLVTFRRNAHVFHRTETPTRTNRRGQDNICSVLTGKQMEFYGNRRVLWGTKLLLGSREALWWAFQDQKRKATSCPGEEW